MPGGTSYITPSMLVAMPASISWAVHPVLTASAAAQTAQLADVCRIATSQVDGYCFQPLRATVFTEEYRAPGMGRVLTERDTGIAKIVCKQRFVNQAVAVQLSPARSFPPAWSLVPSSQVHVPEPMLVQSGPAPVTGPSGGRNIELAPGVLTCHHGRGYWRILVSSIHGWPHTSLTAPAAEGAESVLVDDVTGWTGWTGFVFDGPLTEGVEVSAVSASSPVQLPGAAGTVQAGPGTLTLSAPLANAHEAGTVISALTEDVIHATVLKAAVQALEGIDAIATQSLSGQMAGGTGVLAQEAELALDYYRNWR